MTSAGTGAPRVALISIGIGRVQRGFERYFRDLFEVLRPLAPLVLYKSAGEESPAERVPSRLWPVTRAVRRAGRLAGHAEYHRDCLAYALCLLPQLRRERFDVVHCIDPPLAPILSRLHRTVGFHGTLLFTEGTQMPPQRYPRVDHVHHVGAGAYEGALAGGIDASHMTLVPCGVHTHRFVPPASRAALRERHGVGHDTFVVLAVSAVKRYHKRIDHLVEEVAALEGDVMLWLDGNPEDEEVVREARDRLGARFRLTHLPSGEVPELYGLADVLTHASLEESFGLAIVEAMCAGLPVLVHDNAHFRWLTGDPGSVVPMDVPGALAARLRELRAAPRPDPGHAAAIRARFDWSVVGPAYLEMYRRLARR